MNEPVTVPMSAPSAPPVAEPEVTLAEHEAQFSPNPDARDEDAAPEPPPPSVTVEAPADAQAETPPDRRDARGRYRGKNLASPKDAPRIAELTKNWRETQKELAELKARIATPPPARQEPPAPPTTFSEKEPTLEQFAQEPDPYLALNRALSAYDRRKESAEAAQKQHTDSARAAEEDRITRVEAFFQDKHAAHQTRMDAFVAADPRVKQIFESAGEASITPVTAAAVVLLDEQSPQALLYLAQHPDLVDELTLLTLDKPITPPLVAIVQRRLKARMQAVSTGSAAPAHRPIVVPRPPNPVRTAPQAPSDQPPGDGASLADHERYWGPRRRQG